ncbi:exodeoxyribonuclease V subunit gamma [Trinickia terrae]|uniref:RecBCD enzyme subunit RecC n=1 Tax=Trinickia terrae TaxID=2571161 RepID=A0A4V5PJL6_9BURK|nr:exodeoxyribonuclease V subunit gamma [Trinickia terrae]TKC86970.1 exodeoxyribonuclease V subunit gamma [Trinickia terrae]
MLQLFYSNRYETLADALLDDLSAAPSDPWVAQQIIVPSAAVRRHLELDIAARHGVCANVNFSYLAQWLWAQIGGVIPVPEASPLAPDRLVWRCYRLLGLDAEEAGWNASPRLASYLAAADAPMRYELARRVAAVLDHYLTYRPEWLAHWQQGGSIFAAGGDAAASIESRGPALRGASGTAREDERWQAALWRALLAELGGGTDAKSLAVATPPAYRFLAEARSLDLDAVMRARWPESVHVFALPTMPPLHIALLRELSRWIDVRVYAMNPCRQFWFDIVSVGRLEALDAAGQLDYQEVGHPLLAEWGRQTQAQLHMLHELTESAASAEATRFAENPAPTWLAKMQNAILDLETETADDDAGVERGIEVHVCHSLSRQLEVLHDRLLGWFNEFDDLVPSDVLVACPDLAAAGPLIDAVFGTTSAGEGSPDAARRMDAPGIDRRGIDRRRIPYRITGLPPSQANPVARVLLDWLSLGERSVSAPELVEWLRVDAVAARYGIDAAALETAQEWLAAAGARRGLAPEAPVDEAVPVARHTFSDALTRLFLGYAMPEGGEPVDAWLPVEGASGSEGELLGRLARFVDDLDGFAGRTSGSLAPQAWGELLLDALARFFDPGIPFTDALADVRDAINALVGVMREGAQDAELPAAVVRAALTEALDDPARGGVPWGGVTFSSLTSLRGLPYRVVCLIGMDDGVLPSLARADEFDLMAEFGKLGDRQRRDDERNLFLDLLLAARERLFIAYTGRSIRDNAALPPAALVDELLDHLATVSAGPEASPAEVEEARRAFIVEHPLQPFAAEYFDSRSGLFTYDAERAVLAERMASRERTRLAPFFAEPLPLEAADSIAFDEFERFWRHPARALLRDRLGIVLADTQGELIDMEPFELDYAGRDALAGRLLPPLLEADGDTVAARVQRVAEASPELPGGATGAVWRSRELGALRRLADNVRSELAAGVERLPFVLDVKPRWPETEGVAIFGRHDAALREAVEAAPAPLALHGTLNLLTETGQVIFRYASPAARDYLSAWLAHLVYCAVRPDGPRRTVWHGSKESFELTPVAAPVEELAPLVALFQTGRSLPLAFFPKSAWAKVSKGDSDAFSAWINDRVRGESDDPALRIAWRGANLSLDEPFGTLARLVFEPLVRHLRSGS